MRLKISITKRKMIFAAVMSAVTVAAHVMAGISLFNTLLFILSFTAVVNLELELNEKYSWLWTSLALAAGSVLTTWLMQYLLLAENLREKITHEKFFLNICCCFAIYLAVQIFTNHAGLTCVITHIAMMLFAGANYFVYEFRGNELTFGDLKAMSTGLSVASNYQFRLNAQAMNAILLTAVYAAGAIKLKSRCKKQWVMRGVCLSLLLLSSAYTVQKTENTVTETWEQKGSYRNGYLLNFVLSIRDSFVDKPDAYSKETVAEIESEYDKNAAEDSAENPTIIAIMDESFADFRALGDLQTNQPVMPFIDSLSENTIKGYALASVFGAKTPNSEWEFLTGNSMAWLPSGSVAYQQYLEEENAYSIVDTLKNEDYTCVAMHPYYASGWSRDTVYPQMGFDETYFLEDFDQSNLMRKYVSDSVMFDKVIERYEEGKGREKLFLLGVTMQNHGGYTDFYENFTTDTYGTNMGYPDVNQYLSLARQTDLAVEKLVTYFSKADEPVVICFFGDHQPSLNTSFYRKLNGKGLSGLTIDELEELFEVPFFIWTNYESESRTVERTSLNYLSTMLLEQAGIALPAYNQFLADLMEVVPAMNARAYYSEDTGRYVHYGDGSAEEEIWLEKYQILQYNGLFDDKNRSQVFFSR